MVFLRFLVNLVFRIGIIELFLVFFVLVNAITFFLYVIDKRRAKNNAWRIRESILLFFTLACGGIGAALAMHFARHKTQKNIFRFTAFVGVIIAIIPMVHIAHSLTLDRIIRYVEVEFRSENWPAELNGYRIAFMTDMHLIADHSMKNVVTELNGRDIDLLLLGGDFSMRSNHYQGTIREISKAITTDGIFGVEGNHDVYDQLFLAMEQYGITPLDNSGTRIRHGFYLAGVHDLWNREPSIAQSTDGADTDDFVLLLSHNPDVSMQQSTSSVDLILAGHTHGGQITFFGFPMYLLRGSITDYGTHFAHGFAYSKDGTPVFTSRGIGTYYNVPRVFARPEVIIFTMYSHTS